MSFDLFSKIDFSFSKFSFLGGLVWFCSLILIFKLVFFNRKSFLYSTITEIDSLIHKNFSKILSSYLKLTWSLITLFELILLRNLTGLFPYVFG